MLNNLSEGSSLGSGNAVLWKPDSNIYIVDPHAALSQGEEGQLWGEMLIFLINKAKISLPETVHH